MGTLDAGTEQELNKKQQNVLDLIDRLEKEGCVGEFDLPQIIVCGDQSSGKSSVLETISRVPFPTKDTLCTRFATELVMRHATTTHEKIIATIIPSSKRTENEKEQIRTFEAKHTQLQNVADIIRDAQTAMGLDAGSAGFSDDVLRIEVSGPHMPNLSLVDLPGFFHSNAPGQNASEAGHVKEMVLAYMNRPRTIILAVVSAKVDLAQQVVTKFAKQVDPTGVRTVGVITKPDTLEDSPNLAQIFLEVAQNKHPELQFSTWHVLRNKKLSEQNLKWEDFNIIQDAFLSKGTWKALAPEQKGIAKFKYRLSQILYEHIIATAAPLAKDVQVKIEEYEQKLSALSAAAKSVTRTDELLEASNTFSRIVEDGISGQYNNAFFRSRPVANSFRLELHARVEGYIDSYGDKIRAEGHFWKILDDTAKVEIFDLENDGVLTRDQFMDLIGERLESSRSVPGQFDPNVLSQLFYDHARNWPVMIEELKMTIMQDAKDFVFAVLEYVVGESIGRQLYDIMVSPALEQLEQEVTDAVNKKLASHKDRKEIKFPKSITDLIEVARQDELTRVIEEKIVECFGEGIISGTPSKARPSRGPHYARSARLASHFSTKRSMCAEMISCLQKYYEGQLQKLLVSFDFSTFDDILLSKLPALFNSSAVKSLRPAQLKALTRETSAEKAERDQLESRLDTLRCAYKELEAYGNVGATPIKAKNGAPANGTGDKKRPLTEKEADKKGKKRKA